MSKPSFTTIFQKFIAEAGNDTTAFPNYVSPTVQISYKGEQKEQGIDNLTKIFQQKAASGEDVTIQDIKDIPGEDAVQLTMTKAGAEIHERYSFGEESGAWHITKVDTDDNIWG